MTCDTMTFGTITLALDGGVAIITLDRPEKLNAINLEMVGEIRRAVAQIQEYPSVRALLFTGAGKAFSSGADLGDPSVRTSDVLEQQFNPLILALEGLRVPIVTAVNGAAVGVASAIALMADIVLMARSAYFLQAFTKVGLAPDGGASWALPRLIGPARASAMMLLAERVPAETAAQWGMVYDIVDDERLQDVALSLAKRLAAGPTRALAITRRGLRAGLQETLEKALEREVGDQREASLTSDHREALAAFSEKRAPSFTGA